MRQQELKPMMGVMKEPEMLPMDLIRRCRTKEEAVALCWAYRRDHGLTVTKAAERMGLSKAHLSKILAGQYGLRGHQESELQAVCGNYAIRQWCAWSDGLELVRSQAARTERRKAELMAELEALERAS